MWAHAICGTYFTTYCSCGWWYAILAIDCRQKPYACIRLRRQFLLVPFCLSAANISVAERDIERLVYNMCKPGPPTVGINRHRSLFCHHPSYPAQRNAYICCRGSPARRSIFRLCVWGEVIYCLHRSAETRRLINRWDNICKIFLSYRFILCFHLSTSLRPAS